MMANTMKDDGEVGAEANGECPDEMNLVNIPRTKSCHSWRHYTLDTYSETDWYKNFYKAINYI